MSKMQAMLKILPLRFHNSQRVVGRGCGKGGMGEWPLSGDRVSSVGDENALELGRGDGYTTLGAQCH